MLVVDSLEYKELFTPEAIQHLDQAYDGLEPLYLDDVVLETRAADLLVVYEKHFADGKTNDDPNLYFEAMNAVVNDGVDWKQMLPKTEKVGAFKDLFQNLCPFYANDAERRTKCENILTVLTKAYSLRRFI